MLKVTSAPMLTTENSSPVVIMASCDLASSGSSKDKIPCAQLMATGRIYTSQGIADGSWSGSILFSLCGSSSPACAAAGCMSLIMKKAKAAVMIKIQPSRLKAVAKPICATI
ncbi:hypothetical protein D3C78_1127920 [compost metagenome]